MSTHLFIDSGDICEYVKHLNLRSASARWIYTSTLRHFEHFVNAHQPFSLSTLEGWLKNRNASVKPETTRKSAAVVNRFFDWMATRGLLMSNPLADLRHSYHQRAIAPIIRALLQPDSASALKALLPPPAFASHWGPVMLQHIAYMRALGFRYQRYERRFLLFDQYLQKRPDAALESLRVLSQEWASLASSPAVQLHRLQLGRGLVRYLRRSDPEIVLPSLGHHLRREARKHQRLPYIYSHDEVARLLATARSFPSPKNPLRSLTLYTMAVLAYCAGLRLGEVVRLTVGDVDLEEESILIRETKFFKSRRLPLAPSVMMAIRTYLSERKHAGAPSYPAAALFWNTLGNRAYSYFTAEHLLQKVLRAAELKPTRGRIGPRVHDLRHAFAVHRLIAWYRQGIDPQSRLPYLATYLGHQKISSTLVYLTPTQELLQEASCRFRNLGSVALDLGKGGARADNPS